MSRGGPGSSNGSSGFKPNGNTTAAANGRDIYQQLIDNDMVKELDDIEAISQQISQHAEVLYNSWKNNNNNNSSSANGMSHVVAPTSPTSPINTLKRNNLLQQQSVSPSLEDQSNNTLSRDLRERGGGRNSPAPSSVGGSPYANGYGGGNGGSVTRGYTVPIKTEVRNGGLEERPTVKISYPGGNSQYGSLDRQNLRTNSVPANFSTNSLDRHGAFNSSLTPNGHHSGGGGYNSQQQPGRNSASLSRNSSFSSPPSSSRESPAKGTKS